MTPDEQIEHERHLAEILEIRRKKEERPSRLSTWLSSSVLTALVGVVGTGIVGAFVSAQIQERMKTNELERQAQEVRTESQNAAALKALERGGTFLSATDDLLVTVNDAYAETGRAPGDIEELRKWKIGIRNRRDAADLEWRRDKRSLGFELQFVFGSDGRESRAWLEVVKAVDSFEACTRLWYVANAEAGTPLAPEEICAKERRAFERTMDGFVAVIDEARRAAP